MAELQSVGDAAENPSTFTLANAVYLTVVECYIDGDQFEVRDGGNPIGTTSVPAHDGKALTTPDVCAAYPAIWSQASFPLAAGMHSIDIRTIAEATGHPSGAGFLRVDPTPYQQTTLIPVLGWAGLATLALGAAGFFALRRA